MLKLYCVGDNNVDINLNDGIVYAGGCTLNAAAYAAMLGHEVTYVSSVGNDRLGRLQLDSLRELGVDVSRAHVTDAQTAWSVVRLLDGDRHFGPSDAGAKQAVPVSVQDVAGGQTGEFDLLYTSTDSCYAPGAFQQFGLSDTPAFCDFSSYWTQDSLLEGARHFTFVGFSCENRPFPEVKSLLRQCCAAGSKLAIGTMGLNGSCAYNGRSFFWQEAYALHAVDSLGAGDSFLTMFVTSYLDGCKQLALCRSIADGLDRTSECLDACEAALIQKSMRFAASFAARTCQGHGAFGRGIPFPKNLIPANGQPISQ